MTDAAESETSYFELFAKSYADTFADFVTDHSESAGETLYAAASETARLNAADRVTNDYCTVAAQTEAYEYFNGIGKYEGEGYDYDSFLWIRDIWSPDAPWSSSVAEDGTDFVSRVGAYATDASRSGLTQEQLDEIVSSYDTVMAKVLESDDTGVNGYLVLPVLAVALNIVSQLIMRRQQKKSGQDNQLGQNKGCMTAMVFAMPLLMAYFAFIYCAAFTLYMVLNSTMSLLINLVTTAITRKMIPIEGARGGVEKHGRPDVGNAKK